MTTTDGGTVWFGGWLPAGFAFLSFVSCGGEGTCVAIGAGTSDAVNEGGEAAATETTDGGRTWTAPVALPAITEEKGITCLDTEHCWVWGQQPGPADDELLPSLDATSDGGRSWVSLATSLNAAVPGGIYEMAGLSCPSVEECIVTASANASGYPQQWDDSFVWTTDGGQHWSDDDLTSSKVTTELAGVSCPSTSQCYAIGGTDTVLLGTAEPGSNPPWSWQSQTLPAGTPDVLNTIECPTNDDCYVAGKGAVVSTNDGGSSWSPEATPASDYNIDAISCPTASRCFAAGGNGTNLYSGLAVVAATDDGGARWVPQYVSGVAAPGGWFSCASPTNCMILQGTEWRDEPGGVVREAASVSTTDAGGKWTAHPFPPGYVTTGLSCKGNVCRVLGITGPGAPATVLNTDDGGATWSTVSLPPDYTQAITCPSVTECLVLDLADDRVAVTTDGGARWSTTSLPANVDLPWRISCASVSTCLVTAQQASSPYSKAFARTVDGGRTWTTLFPPAVQHATVWSLSCPAPDVCYAAVIRSLYPQPGQVLSVIETSDGGSAWTTRWSQAPQYQQLAVDGLSCTAVYDCMLLVGEEYPAPRC